MRGATVWISLFLWSPSSGSFGANLIGTGRYSFATDRPHGIRHGGGHCSTQFNHLAPYLQSPTVLCCHPPLDFGRSNLPASRLAHLSGRPQREPRHGSGRGRAPQGRPRPMVHRWESCQASPSPWFFLSVQWSPSPCTSPATALSRSGLPQNYHTRAIRRQRPGTAPESSSSSARSDAERPAREHGGHPQPRVARPAPRLGPQTTVEGR